MNKLGTPHHEILLLIYQYIRENAGNPSHRNNKYFELHTQYNGNYISNIKADLKRQNYVNEQLELTDKGTAYIQNFCGHFRIRSAELYVQGIAKAGPVMIEDNSTLMDN